MDLLHKQISEIGSNHYFIVSSIENPYLFLRFRGELMDMTVEEDKVFYRMKPTEILETITDIRNFVVGKHFRMKCTRKVATYYKDMKMKGWNKSDAELVRYLLDSCKNNWFNVSIMTTFQTEDEMNQKMSLINKNTIDRLVSITDLLSQRSIKF